MLSMIMQTNLPRLAWLHGYSKGKRYPMESMNVLNKWSDGLPIRGCLKSGFILWNQWNIKDIESILS